MKTSVHQPEGIQAIASLLQSWSHLDAEQLLAEAGATFAGQIAFASSFGLEDQVILDMICRGGLDIPVFTLDTGRLPQETHDLIQTSRDKYGVRIEVLFPDAAQVGQMVSQHGPNLFYGSIELRKLCCQVRKVNVLRGRLADLGAWVCGLRKEQSVTRQELASVQWDESFGLTKLSPLAGWSLEQVWQYVKDNGVPYNALHDQGYPSIGCGPCTRAVAPGDGLRAGRWWWEEPQHRECGLHRLRNADCGSRIA